MKNFYLFSCPASFFLFSCKKDFDVSSVENVNFFLDGADKNFPTIATGDTYLLVNTSVGGEKFNRDFGNDLQSTLKQPTINYSKSGNYQVTLTVVNAKGQPAVKKKSLRVTDRVLKGIRSNSFTLNANNQTGWPEIAGKAKVWIEILKGENYVPISNGSIDASLIYKSAIFDGITSASSALNEYEKDFPLSRNLFSRINYNSLIILFLIQSL